LSPAHFIPAARPGRIHFSLPNYWRPLDFVK
jgi:hypothetical protein